MPRSATVRHRLTALIAALLLSSSALANSPLQRYQALREGEGVSLPGTTIAIASSERDERLSAEVGSILHYPFAELAAALAQAQNWCHFLPLHFNIKACTYQRTAQGELLNVYSGRKYYQEPEQSYQMAYRFELISHNPSQLSLLLSADEGPAATGDYRIELQAEEVAAGTLLHIRSSYRPSLLSTMLSRTYLATLGRDKVGFSRGREGAPVQGVLGVIERNAMRYHLAIDAFLTSRTLPEAGRHEAMLASWYRQNEHYPLQLHEMTEADYLQIKRREWDNQRRLQQALEQKLQLAATPLQ